MTRKDELYYEAIGDDFDRFMSDYDVQRRITLIDTLIPPDADGRVLEVGCGTGRISERLVERGGDLLVTDISERLAVATAERLGCKGTSADATALPFPDQSFELVVSSECIEHTPDPALAARELGRVVAPGGTLVVTTPNRLWFPVVWLAMKLGLRRFQGNESFLWPSQLVAAVAASGLDVELVSGCHLLPWQLPLAKRVLPWFDRWGHRLYPLMINVGLRARRPEQ